MRVIIDSDTNRIENGDNRIFIQLDIDPSVEGPEVISGDYRIQLTNLGAAAVPFHGWVDGTEKGPKFTSHVSRTGTLTIPGTSPGVITVGAFLHVGRNRGGVADFSSRGPTRDTRALQKPDLVAPGRHIVSARANFDGSGCSDCCRDFYQAEPDVTRASNTKVQRTFFEGVGGTSVAAPHVAGAIALMFEKDPNQTADQILNRLRSATRKTDDMTLPHDNAFGTGILDVSAALLAVPGTAGGGGGGAGGGGGGGPVPMMDGGRVPAGPAFARARGGGRPETSLAASMPFAALRERALDTPGGQLYAAIVSRYFSEIRGLIRSNRRVGTVWRRIGGPLLIRQLVQRVFEPDRPLPSELAGESIANGMLRFLAMLRRYGSPDLQRDIERFGPLMLAIEGQSLNHIFGQRSHPHRT
jgi:subtilisin family serine protease